MTNRWKCFCILLKKYYYNRNKLKKDVSITSLGSMKHKTEIKVA